MTEILTSLLGPRIMGPAFALALCYPLHNWARPIWKIDPYRRIPLAAYTALCAYVAVVVVANYPQFLRWRHVPEILYPALGGIWGIEHFLGFIAAWLVYRRAAEGPDLFKDTTIFLRGRRLISHCQAFAKAKLRLGAASGCHLFWGMVPIRLEERLKNFLVVGAPGSGKTVTIQLLLQSIVPWMKPGSLTRMLLYDAKSDLAPILSSMKPECPILTLNPFVPGSVAWDMARDIKTPKDAAEVAAILVPESSDGEHSRFFLISSRLVIQGVIESLILSKSDTWTLRDVILALKSPKRIEAVLSKHKETRHILANLAETRVRNNVFATVQNERERFTSVAAAWHKIWPDKSRRLSLSAWIHSESLLLLGQATAEGSPVRALNQLVLQRIAELLDREPNSSKQRTWLVLDELTDLNYVRGLDLLLRRGRSKGVSTVLGFQTWPGMVRAFKADLASEITALCGYKSFLGVNDPPTAEWAAAHFGNQELIEYRVNHSESRNDDDKRSWSRSRNVQQVTRPSVMPEELLTIPPSNEENGFVGYHLSPHIKDGYKSEVAWSWVMEQLRSKANDAFNGATFSPGSPIARRLSVPPSEGHGAQAEASFQYLQDWSDEECLELGLPPLRELDAQPSEGAANPITNRIKNMSREDLNN